MNRGLLVAVVALLVVASVVAPTGAMLDAPGGAATDDASGALDLGVTGSAAQPPGGDDSGSVTDGGVNRDDLDRSVAADRGPPTVAGPLQSKLPDGGGASTAAFEDGPTAQPSDGTTTRATADGSTTQTTADGPTTFAPDEVVEVVIVSEPGQSGAVVDAVGAQGGQVGGTYADRVAANLPARAIEALAATDAVRHVREPAAPVNQGTISEGVDRMRADELHDLGNSGENATIAVVDVGFNPDNEKIADQITATRDFGGSGFSSGTTRLHGTASAEAVADVAPNASLVLVSIGTDSDFFEAADYIETETDADAVTMSLGWFPSAGPLDGTDHLSQRINESTQRGLLWVTSAGNQGEYGGGGYGMHYDRAWTPHENATNFMDFGVLDGWETALPIRNFGGGSVYVSWHEDTSGNETYNVLLYGEDSNGDLVHLRNSSTSSPYEVLSVGSSYDPLYLEIEDVDAQEAHHVDVHTRSSLFLTPAYTVTQSTLIPATSSDVITVAAVDQYDDRIAAYSSRGPTVDGRQGIDVAAPTNVSQVERDSFTGTSAAAPHVGGLAGLLASADPTATAADIRLAIETSGRAVSGDGAAQTDDTSGISVGSGHVDALAAFEALGATGNLTGTVTSAVTGDPIQNATVSVYSADRLVATANATDGSYDRSLNTGVYDVTVAAPDYQPRTIGDVAVEIDATTVANASVLPQNGTIGGTVTDASGAPVADATVGLANGSVQPTATDANGTYTLADVPAEAERVLDVRARAYHANASVNATLAPNGSAVRNVTIEQRDRYLGVDDLAAPDSAEPDESFTAAATIVNLGVGDWNDTVVYRVDGERRASVHVSLNATNATRVAFDDAIGSEGTHELSIETANETPSIDVAVESAGTGGGFAMPSPPKPTATADVDVVSASVAADGPFPVGAPVTVDVRLHNAGDADGSIDLELTADGDRVASSTARVPAGATVEQTLSTSFDEPGTYALAVDGEDAGTIEVREPVDAVPESANDASSDEPADAPADETPGFGLAAALLAVFVALLARRRP